VGAINSKKVKVIALIAVIIIVFNTFLYIFNKVATPAIISMADVEMRAKVTETINTIIINKFSSNDDYKKLVDIEKDSDGNIVLLSADTMKMNKIAGEIASEAQTQLNNMGMIGIKIPLSYILNNNILAYYGPSITVKMRPLGYIETSYSSDFQSAGINQTRLKIYINVVTDMRVTIPLKSSDSKVTNEVPISETVVVGKIPQTAISMDLQNAGTKLNTGTTK
jgi:sporulation protein YunB